MAKTRRMITESLSQVDIVIELLDARIPKSSKNPEIDKLTANKPRLVLLTKAALADPVATRRWVEYYSEKSSHKCLAIDTLSGEGIKQISPTIREILKEKLERYAAKGMIGKQIRAMVVGIPNVGKSSLINKLCHDEGDDYLKQYLHSHIHHRKKGRFFVFTHRPCNFFQHNSPP